MFKRDWMASSKLINYSTLNYEHNWRINVFNEEINKHALPTTITRQGED